MNEITAESSADLLRREAKRRCHLLPGSGFTSLGYPRVGLAYLIASVLIIVACGAAIVMFSHGAIILALASLLVYLLLYLVEVFAVSRVKICELPVNRLRSAFRSVTLGYFALIVAIVVLLFSTVESLRMRGSGMSPGLKHGERLAYRKHVESSDLVSKRIILFRLNPDNSWSQERVLVTARVLAVPGDRLARRNGRYIVNDQQTQQAVGFVEDYERVITVPEAPDSVAVPENCYFIVQDRAKKSFDSQVLGWARREDIVSTDIRHVLRDGRFLVPAR